MRLYVHLLRLIEWDKELKQKQLGRLKKKYIDHDSCDIMMIVESEEGNDNDDDNG